MYQMISSQIHCCRVCECMKERGKKKRIIPKLTKNNTFASVTKLPFVFFTLKDCSALFSAAVSSEEMGRETISIKC